MRPRRPRRPRRQGGAGEDPRPHDPGLPEVAGERPGVDVADADDPLLGEGVLEFAVRTPVGRPAGRVAYDDPPSPVPPRLGVLRVHPRIADVRGRHDDDLPVVGGVGEGLLIAGHARGEDDLAEGPASGPVGASRVDAAVFEHDDGPFRVCHIPSLHPLPGIPRRTPRGCARAADAPVKTARRRRRRSPPACGACPPTRSGRRGRPCRGRGPEGCGPPTGC